MVFGNSCEGCVGEDVRSDETSEAVDAHESKKFGRFRGMLEYMPLQFRVRSLGSSVCLPSSQIEHSATTEAKTEQQAALTAVVPVKDHRPNDAGGTRINMNLNPDWKLPEASLSRMPLWD